MTLQRYCIKLQRICRNIKIVLHKPQIRNPTKSLRALWLKPPRMRFLLFGQAFTMCWLICEHNAPLPPLGITNDSPSKTFGLSVTGIEYCPVVQPSVLREMFSVHCLATWTHFAGTTMKAEDTTMRTLTFDGMLESLAFLHEKCDTINSN